MKTVDFTKEGREIQTIHTWGFHTPNTRRPKWRGFFFLPARCVFFFGLGHWVSPPALRRQDLPGFSCGFTIQVPLVYLCAVGQSNIWLVVAQPPRPEKYESIGMMTETQYEYGKMPNSWQPVTTNQQ